MQGAMEGFVDIHHHLIYGMDDGAQTWEQTRQMLTSAWKPGTSDRIRYPQHLQPGGDGWQEGYGSCKLKAGKACRCFI